MMVLESGVLPPTLRLYAEAIAAASNNNGNNTNNGSNSSNNTCFSSNQIMAPHPLFPHFASRGFPSMFSGLPPFLHHSTSPVNQHPRFSPANLLNACSPGSGANQQRSNENHPGIEISSRRRQRHHTSNSDDSGTEDPMSPKKVHSPNKRSSRHCNHPGQPIKIQTLGEIHVLSMGANANDSMAIKKLIKIFQLI
ncbi:hypothetical protein M8J77_000785 [Diaphorina citri]|nr:hypothetical protein M8J77_000785 [Diaphorina citri]